MTAILAPAPTQGEQALDRALRIIAARAARHIDSTGDALRWALRTMLAEMAHDDPSPVSDAEQYAAHDLAEHLVEQARRDQQAAEHGETTWAPTPGDAVTWQGHDGVWIVRDREDDDTVWLRVEHPHTEEGSFLDYLASDHMSGALAAVSELRPIEQAAAVTR